VTDTVRIGGPRFFAFRRSADGKISIDSGNSAFLLICPLDPDSALCYKVLVTNTLTSVKDEAIMKRDKHLRQTPDSAHRDIPAHRFWNSVDRDQFELALSDHDKNDKYAAFLQALSDPTYARCSFPTLLRRFNISLHEAQTIYTDHMRHMALLQMCSQLPQVVADVTEDAKSHMHACPRCDGEKVVVFTRVNKSTRKKCPECKGSGEVRVTGDKHARDLVFESMKLTGQKSPLVAMQQNFVSDGRDMMLDNNMEKLLSLSAALTMGRRSIEPDSVLDPNSLSEPVSDVTSVSTDADATED